MYWQKRLNKPNKDIEIENKILKIRKDNPNYGYRRITAMLRRSGLTINKKKFQGRKTIQTNNNRHNRI